jgi:hypothetical protein
VNVRDERALALTVLAAVMHAAAETGERLTRSDRVPWQAGRLTTEQEAVTYAVLLLVDAACYLAESYVDDEHLRARVLREVASQLDEAAGNSQPH